MVLLKSCSAVTVEFWDLNPCCTSGTGRWSLRVERMRRRFEQGDNGRHFPNRGDLAGLQRYFVD